MTFREIEEKQEDVEPQVENKDPGPDPNSDPYPFCGPAPVEFDEEEAPVSKEPVAPERFGPFSGGEGKRGSPQPRETTPQTHISIPSSINPW